MSIPEISVQTLKKLLDEKTDIFLLDVRNPEEHAFCNIGGHLIPLPELPTRLHEVDAGKNIIVYCRSGGRSAHAVQFLMQNSFKNVSNLSGGVIAWAREIDSKLPSY